MTDRPAEAVAAAIDQLTWLAGSWHGTHGADRIEEHWSTADGGAMLGMFRAVAEDGPRFYELLAIDTEESGLAFRLRHFDRGLVGWEERDAPLVFDLVAVSRGHAVFLRRGARSWMTYRGDTGGALAVFFEDESGEHAPEDEYRFEHG